MRDWIQILHVEIGETEVDVSMQASILAVETSVDQLGNELAGEGNNEGVGDDRDPPQSLHYLEPDSNTSYLLTIVVGIENISF